MTVSLWMYFLCVCSSCMELVPFKIPSSPLVLPHWFSFSVKVYSFFLQLCLFFSAVLYSKSSRQYLRGFTVFVSLREWWTRCIRSSLTRTSNVWSRSVGANWPSAGALMLARPLLKMPSCCTKPSQSWWDRRCGINHWRQADWLY